MNLQAFYNSQVQDEAGPSVLDALHGMPSKVSVSPVQGSRFAKEIAQDFNPLHDPESKRFCVPGDLLFTLVLSRFGISQKMEFLYQGMVSGNDVLQFAETSGGFSVTSLEGKAFLSGTKSGHSLQDDAFINGFCQSYVAFSGMSFPHILVPLMRAQNVMINPARPMVIYEKMAFEFDRPVSKLIQVPQLELGECKLEVDGKRGKVTIPFSIQIDHREIGHGVKVMTLSGLKPYEEEAMQSLIAVYEQAKANYQA